MYFWGAPHYKTSSSTIRKQIFAPSFHDVCSHSFSFQNSSNHSDRVWRQAPLGFAFNWIMMKFFIVASLRWKSVWRSDTQKLNKLLAPDPLRAVNWRWNHSPKIALAGDEIYFTSFTSTRFPSRHMTQMSRSRKRLSFSPFSTRFFCTALAALFWCVHELFTSHKSRLGLFN